MPSEPWFTRVEWVDVNPGNVLQRRGAATIRYSRDPVDYGQMEGAVVVVDAVVFAAAVESPLFRLMQNGVVSQHSTTRCRYEVLLDGYGRENNMTLVPVVIRIEGMKL